MKIKLKNNEEMIKNMEKINIQLFSEKCEPYCEPNCNPICTHVCSPSCNPCYPLHHCNPEAFYCAPEREE